jgi:transcriptional regulator with XRE-family HTH domain
MWASMAIRIRRARLGAAMTQSDLARLTGVNRSAVAQWERTEGGTTPSVANLASIAVATRVAFEWLATGRGTNPAHALEVPTGAVAYAMDEFEAHCLDSLRRLTKSSQRLVCELLEEMSGHR